MANAPTKQQQIFEACDQLHDRGDNVTIAGVGQELVRLGYVRGSDTTRSIYIKQWREQCKELEVNITALPQRPDKLALVIDEIRSEAQREAGIELENKKAVFENKIKELHETLQYAHQEIADLRIKNVTFEQECQMFQQKAERSADEIKSLKQQCEQQEQKHAESKSLDIQKIDHLTSEKIDLKAQIQKLIEALQHLQGSARTERSDLMERMESQRHQYIADHAKQEGTIHRLEKEIVKSTVETTSLKTQLEQTKSYTNTLEQFRDKTHYLLVKQSNDINVILETNQHWVKNHNSLNNDMQTKMNNIEREVGNNTEALTNLRDFINSHYSKQNRGDPS